MKIGFIGTGNMGSGIIKGLINSNFVSASDINVYDLDKVKIENLVKEYKVLSLNSEIEIVKNSNIVILAVKPHIYPLVLNKIKNDIADDTIILTIAAGFSLEKVESIVGSDKKIVRTMPNTPAQVLEAMTAVSFNKNVNENEKNLIFKLLNSFGKSVEIEEKLMHAYTGISGSLPAYVYMFMEALADGGVLEGIARDKAYEIVAQTVLGSAKMLLETKKHPGQLKDEVSSPGGTTIEAIRVLESKNFRGNIIEAVVACTDKSKKLAGEK